jgi:8-oxo-dGTP diphosphatase
MEINVVAVTDYSLIFPVFDRGAKRDVLLGLKRPRGPTASMKFPLWSGLGGRREEGETFRRCAVRELREESYLEISEEQLFHKATVLFSRTGEKTKRSRIVVYELPFEARRPDIEVYGEEYVRSQWFRYPHLPAQQMLKSDASWVPNILQQQKTFVRVAVEASEDFTPLITKMVFIENEQARRY